MQIRILRFIFPFVYVRNWHTGAWELSSLRLTLVSGLIVVVLTGTVIAYQLQKPVEYVRELL